MKYIIAVFSAAFLALACNKNENKKDEVSMVKDQSIKKQFIVDSLIIKDSVVINKNLTISYDKKILLFPSIENKILLDSIYKDAVVESNSYDKKTLQANLEKKMNLSFRKFKEDSNDLIPEFNQTWDETSAMKLISNRDNVITISYETSGFSGGAHGFYDETYKVFDLNKNTVMHQDNIFNNPKDVAWDKILKDNFENKEQKDMLLVDKIELNNNFFFDDKKITFVYNQYEITAYAAGVVFISIDFVKIKNQLKPEYIKDFKIK